MVPSSCRVDARASRLSFAMGSSKTVGPSGTEIASTPSSSQCRVQRSTASNEAMSSNMIPQRTSGEGSAAAPTAVDAGAGVAPIELDIGSETEELENQRCVGVLHD